MVDTCAKRRDTSLAVTFVISSFHPSPRFPHPSRTTPRCSFCHATMSHFAPLLDSRRANHAKLAAAITLPCVKALRYPRLARGLLDKVGAVLLTGVLSKEESEKAKGDIYEAANMCLFRHMGSPEEHEGLEGSRSMHPELWCPLNMPTFADDGTWLKTLCQTTPVCDVRAHAKVQYALGTILGSTDDPLLVDALDPRVWPALNGFRSLESKRLPKTVNANVVVGSTSCSSHAAFLSLAPGADAGYEVWLGSSAMKRMTYAVGKVPNDGDLTWPYSKRLSTTRDTNMRAELGNVMDPDKAVEPVQLRLPQGSLLVLASGTVYRAINPSTDHMCILPMHCAVPPVAHPEAATSLRANIAAAHTMGKRFHFASTQMLHVSSDNPCVALRKAYPELGPRQEPSEAKEEVHAEHARGKRQWWACTPDSTNGRKAESVVLTSTMPVVVSTCLYFDPDRTRLAMVPAYKDMPLVMDDVVGSECLGEVWEASDAKRLVPGKIHLFVVHYDTHSVSAKEAAVVDYYEEAEGAANAMSRRYNDGEDLQGFDHKDHEGELWSGDNAEFLQDKCPSVTEGSKLFGLVAAQMRKDSKGDITVKTFTWCVVPRGSNDPTLCEF